MGTLEVPYRPIKRRVSDSRSTGLCGGLHLTRQWVDRRCQQSLPALRKRGLVCRAAEIDLDMLLPQNCYRLTKPQLQQWLKERDLPSTGTKQVLAQRLLNYLQPDDAQGKEDPPSSQAKLPLYTEEQLEQFTNPELCEILTIYQEPLGKRVKADLISRIQEAQRKQAPGGFLPAGQSQAQLPPPAQRTQQITAAPQAELPTGPRVAAQEPHPDDAPATSVSSDSGPSQAADRGQGQQDRDRGASAQFLLWLCDQVEADNQPSPAWLIGPDVAEWTMGEIKQELMARGMPVHGSKKILVERLQSIRAAEQRSADELLSPRKRQLMDALEGRGLPLHGTWPHLAQRLRQSVLQELGAEEVLDDELEPHVDPQEPPTTVALLMGAASSTDTAVALDWARTMLDHLHTAPYHKPRDGHLNGLAVHVFMINELGEAFAIPTAVVYGSTPADFDLNVSQTATALPSLQALAEQLKEAADVVMPMNLGILANTGALRHALDAAGVPYVGPPADAADLAGHKLRCMQRLAQLGYPTVPQLDLHAEDLSGDEERPQWLPRLESWAESHGLSPEHSRFVVKPVRGTCGSSILPVRGAKQAAVTALQVFDQGNDVALVEPFVDATEVSVAVLETENGPIALLPTEIQLFDISHVMIDADLDLQHHIDRNEGWSEEQADEMQAIVKAELTTAEAHATIFDWAKKHTPTGHVKLHTPPRLAGPLVHALRTAAARVFKDLGLRDYARIDFWVVPDAPVPSFMTEADKNTILELEQEDHLHAWDFMASRDSEDQAVDPPDDLSPEDICRQAGGIITVADVNSCCSLERNSMVFLQAARSGLSHEHVLQHIVARARRRAGLEAQPAPPPSLASSVLLPTPLRERQLFTPHPNIPEAPEAWEPAGWRHYFAPGNEPEGYGRDPNQIDDPEGSQDAPQEFLAPNPSYWEEDTDLPSSNGIGPGYVEYDLEKEAQEGSPQRVWILAGGGAVERHSSLASGLNIWHQLRKQRDIKAELFVLTPLGPQAAEPERRKRLVDQRNALIKISNNVAQPVDDELSLDEIENPDLPPVEMLDQLVWAVPYEHTMRYTPEELQEDCEEVVRVNGTLPRDMLPLDRTAVQLRRAVTQELAEAGVQGVAGTWGGDWHTPPLPPQMLSVLDFAEWASVSNAVVFLSVAGSIVRSGQLQSLLGALNVPFTGSQTVEVQICADKVLVADALSELEPQNILMPPRQVVELSDLLEAGESEQHALELYERMCDAVGGPMLCIKPASESNGTGVARLQSPQELCSFCWALRQRPLTIPEHIFAAAHPPVPMRPGRPPSRYVVEPFIATDGVEVTYPDEQQQQEQGEQAPDSPLSRNSPASEDDNAVAPAAQQSDADGTAPNGDSDSTSSAPGTAPARISWVEGGTRWAEVSIGVLCSGEDTHALPFALRLRGENEFPMATADALGQPGPAITPVPPDLISPEVELGVRQRAEWAARHLGLRGLVRFDALMHLDAADLLLLSVDPTPILAPSSLLFRQALAMQPPMYPGELFREMVLGAIVAQPQEDAEEDQQAPQQQPYSAPHKPSPQIKDKRMVTPKRYRGDWTVIGKEMYDTYGPPEKYGPLLT